MPRNSQRQFFGDARAEADYNNALARLAKLGLALIEVGMEPLSETARLLYEGPWVAERYIVLKSLLASDPDAIHPVTKEITLQGARQSAVDTFTGLSVRPDVVSSVVVHGHCTL